MATTRRYQGELHCPKEACFLSTEMPLLDYTGDAFKNKGAHARWEAQFSFYLAHIALGKQSKGDKRSDLYTLLEQLDATLLAFHDPASSPLRLGYSQKLFDGLAPKGYLVVFCHQFVVTFYAQRDWMKNLIVLHRLVTLKGEGEANRPAGQWYPVILTGLVERQPSGPL